MTAEGARDAEAHMLWLIEKFGGIRIDGDNVWVGGCCVGTRATWEAIRTKAAK